MENIEIDIFCQIIDYFGDAGVCVRLARQLHERQHKVRVYSDQPELLLKLYPQAKFAILPWLAAKQAPINGLVIEAFACELPQQYKQSIKKQNCLWLNLDYLSAEAWVNDFHAMPSPQPDGTKKYFFFPGFTNKTGGLLRDATKIAKYNKLRKNRLSNINKICHTNINSSDNDLFIFLFCYPNAPLIGLQQGLINSLCQINKIHVLVAGGPRNIKTQGKLEVINVPFIEQTEFDSLLWLSDINFIRGEDSLAQASWCKTPIIWQAYVQTDNSHIDKLNAWLAINQAPSLAQDLIKAWNQEDNQTVADLLPNILNTKTLSRWQASSIKFSDGLYAQLDLASNIENFYVNNNHKKDS